MDSILFGQLIMGFMGVAVGAFIVWGLESWLHHQSPAAPVVAPVPEVHHVVRRPSPLKPSPEMVKEAEAHYLDVMNKATLKFDHDLDATSNLINEQIKRMSGDIIGTELEHYRESLDELRQHAIKTMSEIEAEAAKERETLKSAMVTELAAEKERLSQQIDAKLGEAVSAFLLETLKHNVDLGAQSKYLMAMLDEHKDELKREVRHEV